MAIDKKQLLTARLPRQEVEVGGLGSVVVRGLSRNEVLGVQALAASGDSNAFEVGLLAAGLVDPVLDEAEIRAWRQAALASEIEPVVDAILELSGLTKKVEKEAAEAFLADEQASSSN